MLARFDLRPQLIASSDTTGTLHFSDNGRTNEVITFHLMTHTGERGPGMTLMRMRSSIVDVGKLDGWKMCWIVFGMVHDR